MGSTRSTRRTRAADRFSRSKHATRRTSHLDAGPAAAAPKARPSRHSVDVGSSVVQGAASILETQLAFGLKAARFLQRQMLDLGASRLEDPTSLPSRLRRDAHEAVDLAADFAVAFTDAVSSQLRRVARVTAAESRVEHPASEQPEPLVRLPGPLKAGQTGQVTLSLQNDRGSATSEFVLESSTLVSPSGRQISASRVSCSPLRVSIPPGDSREVLVSVAVPKRAGPGVYEGTLHAPQLEGVRARLRVEVG